MPELLFKGFFIFIKSRKKRRIPCHKKKKLNKYIWTLRQIIVTSWHSRLKIKYYTAACSICLQCSMLWSFHYFLIAGEIQFNGLKHVYWSLPFKNSPKISTERCCWLWRRHIKSQLVWLKMWCISCSLIILCKTRV